MVGSAHFKLFVCARLTGAVHSSQCESLGFQSLAQIWDSHSQCYFHKPDNCTISNYYSVSQCSTYSRFTEINSLSAICNRVVYPCTCTYKVHFAVKFPAQCEVLGAFPTFDNHESRKRLAVVQTRVKFGTRIH